MHVTRPKSSKGRSRAAVGLQRTPVAPRSPPARTAPERGLRSRSEPVVAWPHHGSTRLSHDDVIQVLQHAPPVPPQSLNKYRVLPSIERRTPEPEGTHLHRNMSALSLSHDALLQQRNQEEPVHHVIQTSSSSEQDLRPRTRPEPPDPASAPPAGGPGSLLLAVRAPCGRRFQQHFDPTDTLQTVRASAEVQYGVRYQEPCIQTMEVPRRTFTDMELTLDLCGIMNRSVLCISERDTVEQQD